MRHENIVAEKDDISHIICFTKEKYGILTLNRHNKQIFKIF